MNLKKTYEELEDEFEIAKEIIKLRKNAALTQKQLADLAGTSQPGIARLESGNYKNVSLDYSIVFQASPPGLHTRQPLHQQVQS